ncbi:tRNA pseudouridine(38-40) synthase TruA [Pedobacter sp. HMF7647]|uniref:tRNA pseudouridine synthase A n=1 Tax=Hufsiella arboris TaxID=2695275 RepID=A0A7K1Y8H4_9SPHI|nr:tRNA pseudouridine(38-40) synthase TruA [Hufsiella arboris]
MNQKRYFIELSYNGTEYHGWQVQPNAVTVQERLDKALSTLLRQPIETTGCGRTDTGVHATQFYAHFDLNEVAAGQLDIQLARFVTSLNALLPFDIAVKRVFNVLVDTHARFSAMKRSYEYHIHFKKNPFKVNRSWLMHDFPDIELMNQAAGILFDYTDFSCFSKSNTQVFTNNCKIIRAEWQQNLDGLVFHISADRFLRNMVRAIVGTLVEVGKGKITPEQIRTVIESKNRSNAGSSVPACGLYLTEVLYPKTSNISEI